MRRRIIILLVLILAIAGGGAWWWFSANENDNGPLVIYGNVDLRQIDLAFTDSGRIADVLVDEGAKVTKDEVLARLDTSRLDAQIAEAEAQAAAQEAVVKKLHNGSRPEEIEQARANVAAAAANAHNAKLTYDRLTALSATSGGGPAVTQSQIDAAKAAFDAAAAQQNGAEQALALANAGARAEDVAQAEAQLAAAGAQVDLLHQQKNDAALRAPIDAVVRSRLLEPGEIATAQRPVFSLAVVDPKWVRAYVSESDLVRVRTGMTATVEVDGGHQRTFTGHVGFISPVAEFTPRTIQTEELRTSLVYEVRVLVDDPDDVLRLGMPATVRLSDETAEPAS